MINRHSLLAWMGHVIGLLAICLINDLTLTDLFIHSTPRFSYSDDVALQSSNPVSSLNGPGPWVLLCLGMGNDQPAWSTYHHPRSTSLRHQCRENGAARVER